MLNINMAWLDKITRDSDRILFFKKTCLIEYAQKKYAFKSDGHIFVAIESDDSTLPVHSNSLGEVISQIEKATARDVSIEELKLWAGAPDYDKCCPNCDYRIEAATRYGKLFGVPINKNLLARALEGFPSRIPAKVHTNDKMKVQYVSGDGWIVGIMPVNDDGIVITSSFDTEQTTLPMEG